MRVGNYSVLVPEGIERDSGHVGLEHGKQYTLRLMNHDHRRCDAEVVVDGKAMGTFRLHGHGQATLERMPDDHGRLTFYSTGTADAEKAGEAGIATVERGLIQVRFVPEKRPVEPIRTVAPIGARPMGLTRSYADREEKTAGGITGLSGHSDQQFVTVGAIDREESAAVTISLRLVTASTGPRPLRAAEQGNRVPEPV